MDDICKNTSGITSSEANELEVVMGKFKKPMSIYIVQSYMISTDKARNIVAFSTYEEAQKWIDEEMDGCTYNGAGYYNIDTVDFREEK